MASIEAGDPRYEPVDTAPEGLKWKPVKGGHAAGYTVLLSFGGAYKLVRSRTTGDVQYFKLRDDTVKSPAEKIDAEPVKTGQVRYNTGKLCWFIDTGGRWFLCKVVDRPPDRIVLSSETGWDSERQAPWEYGALLEFPDRANNPMMQRLRPLKARYR
jgi:hypothetical protein